MRTMNFGNNLNNDKYFYFKGASLSYMNDVTNGLTLALAVRRNIEEQNLIISSETEELPTRTSIPCLR
jgi:hypothetical protein